MTPTVVTGQSASLILATLTTGLVAGLFFAFACAVMPGVRRSSDRTLVEAMQQINIAILNPRFGPGGRG